MSDSGSPVEPDKMMDRIVRWLLLSGNRLTVTAVLSLVIFRVVFVLGVAHIVMVTIPGRMMWYLNGTINGLLTLILIAIGINQVVLSQELDSLDTLYDRTTGTVEFRRRVADDAGDTVSSPQAAEFFQDLATALNEEATGLQQACDGSTDGQLRTEVDHYVERSRPRWTK